MLCAFTEPGLAKAGDPPCVCCGGTFEPGENTTIATEGCGHAMHCKCWNTYWSKQMFAQTDAYIRRPAEEQGRSIESYMRPTCPNCDAAVLVGREWLREVMAFRKVLELVPPHILTPPSESS